MQNRKLLRTADTMTIVGIAMMLIAHAATNYSFWILTNHQQLGQSIENIAQAFEANPSAIRLLNSFEGYKLMILYFILPAITFAGYYVLRRIYKKTNPAIIVFVGAFMFMLGLANALNDGVNLIGILLNKGLI